MKILLTNDDGIYAPGIQALASSLKKIGDVTVVAPDTERSSVGHGITLSQPIWYKKVKRQEKFFGYAISGTPADCVKFAISVLMKKKPDIVVSGINFGQNDGCSVFYSGTVAGAREAALLGIPAVAISLATFVDPHFEVAAQYGAQIVKKILSAKMPRGTFLNVNVPSVPQGRIKGLKATRQGRSPIHGSFQKRVDPNLREYYWMTGRMPRMKNDNTMDTDALRNRYVTVTPVSSDSTDYRFLAELKNIC